MNNFLKKIIWFVFVIPAIYLVFVWNRMPDQVATHFNINGTPDKYGNKDQFVFGIGILTVVNILIYLLLTNVYSIDPKKYTAENKDRLTKIAFTVTAFMVFVSCIVINAGIAGSFKLNIRYVFSSMGFFWAIIGNYMHNIKPNYFAGFRLPWTLKNEDNWKKTHALGGKLWFGGGLAIAAICLLVPIKWVTPLFFIVLTIMMGIPVVYSFGLYKLQKKQTRRN
jgi:uncharacterized membrane protein